MDQQLIEKVINQVTEELRQKPEESALFCCGSLGVAEFVGTATDNTTSLVIAGIDPLLVERLHLGKYRPIGIISGRVGAGPQVMAVDDAIKTTNTEVISIELPRDTEGGAGHGSLIYIGADDVSDARRVVEITLASLDKYFGDVYTSEAGHLELQHTARASYCLEKAFGTPLDRALGMVCARPVTIATVLADVAVKAINVEVVSYSSPSQGTSYSNEVILTFASDSGVVCQAVRTAIEVGEKLLSTSGSEAKSTTQPYI